jgi:hypothetical protein
VEIGPVQLLVAWLIPVPFLALALWRPKVGRLVLGWFFIAMGLCVNMVLVFQAPEGFVEIGRNALLAFYRPLFVDVVALAPALVGLVVALYEVTIGTLMLLGGRKARLGLIGGAVFNLFITPLNPMAVPNLLFVVTDLYLFTRTANSAKTARKAA